MVKLVGHGAHRVMWVTVLGLLAACGGGGSSDQPNGGNAGGGAPASNLVVITAANGDAVARSAAAGALTLSRTAELPVSPLAALPGSQGRLALGQRASDRMWLHDVVLELRSSRVPNQRALAIGTKHPLALVDPDIEPCAKSGTLTITRDDRDSDGRNSAGDLVTFVYDNCRNAVDEVINGSVVTTVLTISQDGTALTFDARLRGLSATARGWSISAEGNLRVAYSTPSVGNPRETYDMTAVGTVTSTVSSSLPFSDTVTLAEGWREITSVDASVLPAAGNREAGQTTLSVNGSMRSTQAGGEVVLSTTAPFVSLGEDAYPRTGVLHVQGQRSALRISALTTNTAQIGIDADGDNFFESTKVDSWNWIF